MKFLRDGINILTLLTGAFGSYLLEIAPPEDGLIFIAGISVLSGLIFYLIIRGISSHIVASKKTRNISLLFSIITLLLFLMCSFSYENDFNSKVFDYADDQLVGCGTNERDMTGETLDDINNGLFQSPEDKLRAISDDYIGEVWKPESLTKCKFRLKLLYFLSVNLFFVCIFTLTLIYLKLP